MTNLYQEKKISMIKVTLDHNCIISLEKGLLEARLGKASSKDAENAWYLISLIALHYPPRIIISAAAIGASERLRNRGYNHNFANYEERIALLGLLHTDLLMPKPVGYYGMTYYGHAVYGGPVAENLERDIHRIMFPDIDFNYQAYYKNHFATINPEKIERKWRNAKCDVLAMWSHMNSGGTIFTTADNSHMLKNTKRSALIKLGAGDILSPEDTLKKVRALCGDSPSEACDSR